jgi:hypothetical protein
MTKFSASRVGVSVADRVVGDGQCVETSGRRLRPAQGLVIVSSCLKQCRRDIPATVGEPHRRECLLHLREHFAAGSPFGPRVRVVSAEHGMLRIDDHVGDDRLLMNKADAIHLRTRISSQLAADLATMPAGGRVLLVGDPLYLLAVEDIFDHVSRLTLTWIPDQRGWRKAAATLAQWGWL